MTAEEKTAAPCKEFMGTECAPPKPKETTREIGRITTAKYGRHPDRERAVLSMDVKLGSERGSTGTFFFDHIPQPEADKFILAMGVNDVAHLVDRLVEIKTDSSGNSPNSRVVGPVWCKVPNLGGNRQEHMLSKDCCFRMKKPDHDKLADHPRGPRCTLCGQVVA